MCKISLCSYTYNDASLLHDLLRQIPAWERQPDEIILVDDGSDVPFELSSDEKTLPAILIRQAKNMGFTTTKHFCMNAATGDIIVSLDCDVHLEGDFLGNACRILQDQSIGLVGPSDAGLDNTDLLSAYLTVLGNENFIKQTDDVTFINGPALAIRRELWEKIGGYSGHPLAKGSDQYLSHLLRQKGYKLVIDSGSNLKISRTISRHAFCRRDWAWCRNSWLHEMTPNTTLPDYARLMLLQTRARCAAIVAKYNPAWTYFELLHLVYIYMEFCNALGPQGMLPVTAGKDLLELVQNKLAGYPALLRLLRADLLRTGALPLHEPVPPLAENTSTLANKCEWTLLSGLLEEFSATLLLEYLDKHGVQEILNDEASTSTDFSSY